jgi:type I restriction enzyme R subunit
VPPSSQPVRLRSVDDNRPGYVEMNEADTCRILIEPKLVAAHWDTAPHSITEQYRFTLGRIIVAGTNVHRGDRRQADYLLRYRRDFALAVIEAKSNDRPAGDGLQQAKAYATQLGLLFAYATNGIDIIEFDFDTGIERKRDDFPTPAELWQRYRAARQLQPESSDQLLTPSNHQSGFSPRYYQEIAINRAVEAVLQGRRRILLTLATGTGKTPIAFQICWKLWTGRWNRTGEHRRPRILYLADRNVLVDDPKDKTFAAFGDAKAKIENGVAPKSREIYFSIYQALAKDANRPALYREYDRDYFDLIIVDECHRGSADDESNWREILDYFEPAYQLGMTATPLRQENRDTYSYFGEPLYTYSLRQGIEDGFLAPYRVYRIVSTADAIGYRPAIGEVDTRGRPIPDRLYGTPEFERQLSHAERTRFVARHLTEFLNRTDPFAKTIVFCVDQEHAEQLRHELAGLSPDVIRRYPDYVCRIVSDEGDIGRGYLSQFQDVETVTPVIVTTSQMLTTGVDAPTVKNIVILRMINSMVEFKQIIGRGTRVREDYGKLYFNIIDYTGSATARFADPDFDGDPLPHAASEPEDDDRKGFRSAMAPLPPTPPRPKLYVDGQHVLIAAEVVYELDAEGRQLRVIQLTDYAKEKVRALFIERDALRQEWGNAQRRRRVIQVLADKGIDLDQIQSVMKQPDADPFDLLCHIAYGTPITSRRQRVDRLRRDNTEFFKHFRPEAQAVLDALLDKYAAYGVEQWELPNVLKVPPISERGNVVEVTAMFGGPRELQDAVRVLEEMLYAA